MMGMAAGPGKAVARELATMAGFGIDCAPLGEGHFDTGRDSEKGKDVAHSESAGARGLARPTYFGISGAERTGVRPDIADDLGMATGAWLGIDRDSAMQGHAVRSGTALAGETEMPVHCRTGRERETVVCSGVEAAPERETTECCGRNAGETETLVHR